MKVAFLVSELNGVGGVASVVKVLAKRFQKIMKYLSLEEIIIFPIRITSLLTGIPMEEMFLRSL